MSGIVTALPCMPIAKPGSCFNGLLPLVKDQRSIIRPPDMYLLETLLTLISASYKIGAASAG